MHKPTLLVCLLLTALAVAGAAWSSSATSQSSGFHGWAQIDPGGGSPTLVRANGFTRVSSPLTGVYCLTGAPGVALTDTAPVASQEANLSSTLGLVLPRRIGAPNSSCPAGQLQVDTFDAGNASSPTLVNTVGFDIYIP
jgi:hypothetical protein